MAHGMAGLKRMSRQNLFIFGAGFSARETARLLAATRLRGRGHDAHCRQIWLRWQKPASSR